MPRSESVTTTYGYKFSQQEHMDGVLAYINGGDYSHEETEALSGALFEAFVDEVNEALPDDVRWVPATSEFIYPADGDLPEQEEMAKLFASAWTAVEARFGEIHDEALKA